MFYGQFSDVWIFYILLKKLLQKYISWLDQLQCIIVWSKTVEFAFLSWTAAKGIGVAGHALKF